MASIVLRSVKGSALTWVEGDANFSNLNTEKLERNGSIPLTGPLDFASAQSIQLGGTNAISIGSTREITIGAPASGIALTLNSVAGGGSIALHTSNGTVAGVIRTNGSNDNLVFGASSNHGASIATNNTQRLFIANSGNVSIAAPASGTTLALTSVATGTPLAFGDGIVSSIAGYGGGATLFFGNLSNHPLAFISNNIERISVAAAGNVTVKVPASGTALTVNGITDATCANFTNGTVSIQIQQSSSNIGFIGTQSNHALRLITNNTARINITNAGNVTINAPSSGNALVVTGASGTDDVATFQGATTSSAVNIRAATTGTSFIIFGNTTNNERIRIRADNNRVFAISNDSGSSDRFTIGANGNVTIAAPSTGVGLTVTASDTQAATFNGVGTHPVINLVAGGAAATAFSVSSNITGTSVGPAGGGSALPLTPSLYLRVNVNGVGNRLIPLYETP
jgi:hypothetical protein